jgi:myo-inositol-1(or 4)-monophosphatase
MNINIEEITKQVIDLSNNVGKFIQAERGKISSESIEKKGLHDFVTYVDKSAEEQLVKGLQKILPEAGFIVEEETIKKEGNRFNWIVDPLDGTTNYIHGLTPFAISIALTDNDKVVSGVVNELGFEEVFYSWGDNKAFLDGKPIRVSKVESLKESMIATGFPYNNFTRLQPFLHSLEHFMKNTHGIRRFGSAATDLVYTACGRFEGFYEYSLNPWDVAAGAFIVEQAGGVVSDFQGGSDYIFGEEIVAATSNIHEEFKQVIKNSFYGT